jgi:hypothetical protein
MKDTRKPRPAARVVPPILGDYKPLRVLWTGAQPPYASEQAARWALRQHREQLAAASALALHQGRLLVHPELFVRVVERTAIEAVQRRAAGELA